MNMYEYECFDDPSGYKLFVRVYAADVEGANKKVANMIVKTRYNLKAIVEVPDESWKEDMANSLKKMANEVERSTKEFDKIQKELKSIKNSILRK